MPDLFTELLETVLNYNDGITASHLVYIPALGELSQIADPETIDRCLKRMAAERAKLKREGK